MKKKKANMLKKKQKKAKYLKKKSLVGKSTFKGPIKSTFKGPIEIGYSGDDGKEIILLDRRQEWLDSLK